MLYLKIDWHKLWICKKINRYISQIITWKHTTDSLVMKQNGLNNSSKQSFFEIDLFK